MANGPKRIFDFHAQARMRRRASNLAGERFLWREAAEGLAERLGAVNRRFSRALAVDGRAADLLPAAAAEWRIAAFDENEKLDIAESGFDLAVSILSLHAINDLPGALAQIRGALKPDGLFLAAVFGGETLHELCAALIAGETAVAGGAARRIAPFADIRDLGGLLQRAGFALPVADNERTQVRYRAFATLIGDLRLMGETGILAERRPLGRAVLAAAQDCYAADHADADGRLRATFDIVYLTGWAPDESQPKPLRPGSAQMRLAEALGTVERKAE
jgi:SAM-dependent methyltransferase